jgi:hypothetical protein
VPFRRQSSASTNNRLLELQRRRTAKFELLQNNLSTRQTILTIPFIQTSCSSSHCKLPDQILEASETMTPTDPTNRFILKPQSIAQRVRDNETAAASPTATSPMLEGQRITDNQADTMPSAAFAPMAETEHNDQSTSTAAEDQPPLEGIELVKFVVPILNEQTTAYIELKRRATIAASETTLAQFQAVSDGIQYLYGTLTTATIDHISGQTGIFLILGLQPSEITVSNLMIVAAGLRKTLFLVDSNIERVWENIMNQEVMEEVKCGLKKLKHRCLFGYAEHYAELLRVLEEEYEGVKRREEKAGFVGPRTAAFVSLFPSRNGMGRLFCGEQEE